MGYVLLSTLGSLCFAFNSVTQRRAVLRILDATTGVLVTVPLAVILFLVILIVRGQVGAIAEFSWQGYLWLAAAGIFNYVLGRSFRYNLVQLSGANISNILTTSSPLVSVALGVLWLHEALSWELAVGVALIISGLVITGLNSGTTDSSRGALSGIPRKAYLLGLGTGISWGISPILIKLGLGSTGSPVAGAFIAHLAATVVLSPLLLRQHKRASLTTMQKGALGYFCLSGLFTGTAQLFRYTALSLGPASVVSPVFAISPIFALFLAFLFNRKLEVFNRNIIVGTVVVIIGAVLLTLVIP